MRNLHIQRQHHLTQSECRDVATGLLDKLVARFGGSISCQGDDYCYSHPTGVKAIVAAGPDELSVSVKLGLLTSALAPKLDTEINRVLDEHLGAG